MDEEEKRTKRQETIQKAYEFSLRRVGQSLHAFPLWNDFFDFLEADDDFSIGMMNEQYVRSGRVIKTRKWYQVAIASPFLGVEKIWNRYTQFEKDEGGNVRIFVVVVVVVVVLDFTHSSITTGCVES